MSGIKR